MSYQVVDGLAQCGIVRGAARRQVSALPTGRIGNAEGGNFDSALAIGLGTDSTAY